MQKLVSGKIPVGQLTDRSLYLQRMVLLLYFPQLSQLFVLGLDPPELSFCPEGIILSQSIMPQLDKFTYFTQFFWSCLFLFTFYIPICNDGDGVLGISRILKLRNQLVSNRGNKIRSNDPKSHS
ncbi:hypothetical protein PHAVU_011G125800 [Phaseolus vulgaris]|uniref:H(+)-transporting two-sector ATPase n=1 Tax=Phaseolus vulgaris TaxID=3885 RepID=V7AIW6_PHAVU|nr:hypothetical protein PHAVU_011G125800g [Phaseolus vulgaris]ESW04798.1 hypothetical protein PHAVU_011G125800g [Phaseolus vulgaris]